MNKFWELFAIKIIGSVSVMPFLAGICVLGFLWYCIGFNDAAPLALFIGGIVALTEVGITKRDAYFLQMRKEFDFFSGDDIKTFLKLTEHAFGREGLSELKTQDVTLDGLIFRHVTTARPSPFATIAGPFCPRCQKPLYFAASLLGIRYTCLCGFKKTIRMDPKTLYLQVRQHFNLPS
jgi:hypothetical protein